jgi:predicted RNA-binding protein with PUA domain
MAIYGSLLPLTNARCSKVMNQSVVSIFSFSPFSFSAYCAGVMPVSRKLAPRHVMVSGTEIELLENNMNVIATVVDEYGIERTDAVIRVSTNGELRGEAIAPNYESEYFLTV